MARPRRLPVALSCLALLVACGDEARTRTLGVRPKPGDFDAVLLEFEPLEDAAYVVELAEGPGAPFRRIMSIPKEHTWYFVYGFPIPPSTPEATEIRVRLHARAGLEAWTAEGAMFRGVRPIDEVTVSRRADEDACGPGGVDVAFEPASAIADRVGVERRVVPAAGEPGAWESLPPGGPASPYVDASPLDVGDGATVEYRVTRGVRDVETEPVTASLPPAPAFAPTDVRAEVVDGTVRLAWKNRSGLAGATVIRRGGVGYSAVATVPVPGEAWEDAAVQPGLHVYALEPAPPAGSWAGWPGSAASEVLVVVPDPAAPASRTAVAVRLPGEGSVTRADDGTLWRIGETDLYPRSSVFHAVRPDGAGDAIALTGGLVAGTRAVVDGEGVLHTIVIEGDICYWDGDVLHHAAVTGCTATTEPIGTAEVPERYGYCDPKLALAPDGGLRFAWDTTDGYAFAASGAPAVEAVDTGERVRGLVVTADGGAELLAVSADFRGTLQYRVHRRGPAGAWSVAEIPPATELGRTYSLAYLPAPGGGAVWLLARDTSSETDPAYVRVREDGTWGAAAAAPFAKHRVRGAAASATGRIAVALASPAAIAVRERDGTWTETRLVPGSRVDVGFETGGRWWAVTGDWSKEFHAVHVEP